MHPRGTLQKLFRWYSLNKTAICLARSALLTCTVKSPEVGRQRTLISDSLGTFAQQLCALFTRSSATLTHSPCASLCCTENVYNADYDQLGLEATQTWV